MDFFHLNHCIRIYQLDLEVSALATLQMDGYSPSPKSIKLPAALATPSTHMPTVVITKYSSGRNSKVGLCDLTSGCVWHWVGGNLVQLSQNKGQDVCSTPPAARMKTTSVWSLCCVAPKTTDSAISTARKSGDRLLARWHKIKIQILLEKLMRCSKTYPSLYIMSVRAVGNDREK